MGNNRTDPTDRSPIMIGKSIDKKTCVQVTMFVVNNMKTRQLGEDPGNQLDLRKLFISVLLSSTLVTFPIAVSRSKNVFYSQLQI